MIFALFNLIDICLMLIGHQKQWKYLERLLKEDRLPHALLFSGQEKLGKKTLTIEFFYNFFGKNPLNHPDFIFIEPKKGVIQISQIRELIWRVSLKPYLSKIKIGVIDQAHLMTREAQNCFLKTLEEPSKNSVLILISSHHEMLLPTIISRCQILKFFPIDKKEIEKYLKNKGLSDQEIKIILSISQGRPGVAFDLAENLQKIEEREDIIKQFKKLINSDLFSRFNYIETMINFFNPKEVLEIWLSFLRESLISNLKKENYLSIKKDIEKIKKIQETFLLISSTNINPHLAFENLFLII